MNEKLTEMLTQLQEVAKTITEKLIVAAPDAIDMVLWVKRIEGMQFILIGLVFLILATCAFYMAKKFWKDDSEESALAMSGISFGLCTISFVFIFNLWNWVSIFKPELTIAREIMNSVLR